VHQHGKDASVQSAFTLLMLSVKVSVLS